MLSVWPDSVMRSVSGKAGYDVLVRPSMAKFPSNRNSLEVNNQSERIREGGNPKKGTLAKVITCDWRRGRGNYQHQHFAEREGDL